MRPHYLDTAAYRIARDVLSYLDSLEGVSAFEARRRLLLWAASPGASELHQELSLVALHEWPRLDCDVESVRDQRIGHLEAEPATRKAPIAPEELFADLACFRRLGRRDPELSDECLTRLANALRVRSRIASAYRIEICEAQNTHALVRSARGLKLMNWVVSDSGRVRIVVGASARGPSRNFLEARALCAFVFKALQVSCSKVECFLTEGGKEPLVLGADDPIAVPRGKASAIFDSALERRVLVWLRRKQGAQWTIAREAEPLTCGRHLVFPDFSLQQGAHSEPIAVEVVGFWSEDYLCRKLEISRLLKHRRLVFLLDAALVEKSATGKALAGEKNVFLFRKERDAESFFSWLEGVGRA